MDQLLLEKLLMSALIEARSCERFKMLWKNIQDEQLSQFYYELMISEAGHYKTFLQLAKEYLPGDKVDARWRELLEQEAQIVKNLEVRGDRIH
jgi:tRNA-(ms[2]io[6]A)-hydroxylase